MSDAKPPLNTTYNAEEIAGQIFDGFLKFWIDFKTVTSRAEFHFRNKDWAGIQSDTRDRLHLYMNKVQQLSKLLRDKLGQDRHNEELWHHIKGVFTGTIRNYRAFEVAETFYNSVCRKVFYPMGINPHIMFVTTGERPNALHSEETIYRSYSVDSMLGYEIKAILEDFQLPCPFENLERDILCIQRKVKSMGLKGVQARLDVIKTPFYRNKAAYLIGRVQYDEVTIPVVMPILNGEHGLYVDALLIDSDEVSKVFGFTRSYFMVQVEVPSELVQFLKTLMPLKSLGELYNSIGFNKHGKTQFYRDFLKHMEQSDDQFVIAPGIRGMVMSVFTLPSYNIVFKLMKDRFDPPKSINHETVKAKYQLVKEHDRVGRMADTHEFNYFEFERYRFADELLEELLRLAPSIVSIQGSKVIIKHLYTERKMIPLNIYLEQATPEQARKAIDQYGNAIRELATANIFPGDMLLKNFGVTRHGRVVFYDYDEISLLTDCNFRVIPEPRNYEEEMSSEPWYSVGPHDVFPEEFRNFLVGNREARNYFFDKHSYLFEASFWKQMQKRIRQGEIEDFYPYENRFPAHCNDHNIF